MGCKAVETTCNINNTFGPGTAHAHAVYWWFKKFFAKETSLEDEEGSGWTSEVNNNQLRASLNSILLQSQEKLLNNSTSAILQSFGI